MSWNCKFGVVSVHQDGSKAAWGGLCRNQGDWVQLWCLGCCSVPNPSHLALIALICCPRRTCGASRALPSHGAGQEPAGAALLRDFPGTWERKGSTKPWQGGSSGHTIPAVWLPGLVFSPPAPGSGRGWSQQWPRGLLAELVQPGKIPEFTFQPTPRQ